tara:strand:+ start:3369 stop:3491 length:123 start_codon:yes stop_codon:yes gene_type:complete
MSILPIGVDTIGVVPPQLNKIAEEAIMREMVLIFINLIIN